MNLFASMHELLRSSDAARDARPRRAVAFLAGAVVCFTLYAVAAGMFQGGSSVALAMLKIPLIIVASVALCLPSFYVFTTLSGAEYSPREFATVLAAFCGITGLILLGLMPVTWLFSVSSISLGFVVWMHIWIWLIALAFGRRILVDTAPTARAAVGVWLVLLFLVSLQMTTYLRPVLWRAPGAPLFTSEKKSFVTHLHEVAKWTPPAASQSASGPGPDRR